MGHEKQIEIRWRDLDGLRHVNNAVYATYLEIGRDAFFEEVLPEAKPWDYVLVRLALDFRRELRFEDRRVVVSCAVERVGRSSLTLREEIRTSSGELAAECETVVVARDSESGRPRPLTDAERTVLEGASA
ncbi:MAG TPA: thioesterase family protein [Gaiellaceae bacterium]|nr:thioesterase family protein [Gaiellaceae bacterium]